MSENFWAIVPAAGLGKRMQSAYPKQYIPLKGKPILQHSLEALLALPQIEKVMVVIAPQDSYWPKIQADLSHPKIITTLGGQERFHSVYQGLLALSNQAHPRDWILVHDAVRPWIKAETIARMMKELQNHEVGGLLGVPCRDTLKRCDSQANVITTIERQDVWLAQTPQMFRYQDLCQALQKVITKKITVTDEAAAIELLGKTPRIVLGQSDNYKITYPEDLSD